jgi:UDP-MurNAc hydroxylase
MNSPKISFLNHASFAFYDEGFSIISDPWYWGSAFDDGWKLLYENPKKEIVNTLNGLTHIYISHEHPDHFSISFFKKFKETIINNKIQIIFQQTIDKRVINYLTSNNFEVAELSHGKWYQASQNSRFLLYKNGFIDSSLIIESNDHLFINLNDCDFNILQLFNLNRLLPKNKKKIICNQFSYAAYRADKEWLKRAASFKLNSLVRSFKALDGDFLLPFASYAYFCHEQNLQLNSSYNNPKSVSKYLSKNKISHAFISPSSNMIEIHNLLNDNFAASLNQKGLTFWTNKLELKKEVISCSTSNPKEIEQKFIDFFLYKIKKNNNIFLMKLINYLSFGKVFGTVKIKLIDTNDFYEISFNKFHKLTDFDGPCDIELTSQSLLNIITQPFGIDTLSVNGRLNELNQNGFRKFIFSIGFQSLNSSGHGIKLCDIFSLKILHKIVSIPFRIIKKNS